MNTRDKILSTIGAALTAIATVIVLGFLTGLFVELLWNWLVPGIFGLPWIGFWQACGLLVLTGMLFGSSISVDTDKKS